MKLEKLGSTTAPKTVEGPSKEQVEAWKKAAALKAVDQVKSGMRVGLGTGSTTTYAIEGLIQKVQSGELTDIVGVASSNRSEQQATQGGVKVSSLQDTPNLDVSIDGADEVFYDGQNIFLIKGGGGAHVREKENVLASERFVVIVDKTKMVSKLGEKFALPVEITQGNEAATLEVMRKLGGEPSLRKMKDADQPFLTDNGNLIVDVKFPGGIDDPFKLQREIEKQVPGLVDHGLFLNLAHEVLVADENGVKSLTPRTERLAGFSPDMFTAGPSTSAARQLDGALRETVLPLGRADLGYGIKE